MQTFGYIVLGLLIIAGVWFGGMQYADRDSWHCAYAGAEWDVSVFTSPEGKRVLVKRNHC